MKWFFVADQYGNKMTVETTSPRQAIVAFCRKNLGVTNPSLFKTYQDGEDGKSYHTGYGYGRRWFSVGEINFLREAV